MHTPHFSADLDAVFRLGKAWSFHAETEILELGTLVEAALRLAPGPSHATLASGGLAPAVLDRIASASSARSTFGLATVTERRLPLAAPLARAVVDAAPEEGELGLETLLEHLARQASTREALERRYAPDPAETPILRASELIDLLGEHDALTARAVERLGSPSPRTEPALAQVERFRVTCRARWASTPNQSAAKALYNEWSLAPFTLESAALDAVLAHETGRLGEPPTVGRILRHALLDSFPRGSGDVLDAIEHASRSGLTQRHSPTGTPSQHDLLIGSDALLRAIDDALRSEPIGTAELTRARRALASL